MAATEEVWLPREVHNNDRGTIHTGMMATVNVGGEVSESFRVTNGVKQGCVLAPTLFSIFLSAMLDNAFRDMGDGIYMQSRQSADLFNVAHFRAKTKTTRILMRELLFADDSALVANSAEEMQEIVDAFSKASKKFGLKINIKKTEVLYQPNSTIRKNLRWTGHLMRMSSDRLPKQVLYSQLSSGHRKRERPRLRFKDTIKRNLKLRDIKIDSWTSLSQQRDKWRAIVK